MDNFITFKTAFDDSWKCFASVNLYLTSKGIDAEKIKINTSKRIERLSRKADLSNMELAKDINNSPEFHIKPDKAQAEIIKNLYQEK